MKLRRRLKWDRICYIFGNYINAGEYIGIIKKSVLTPGEKVLIQDKKISSFPAMADFYLSQANINYTYYYLIITLRTEASQYRN